MKPRLTFPFRWLVKRHPRRLVALSTFKGDGRGLLALLHSFDPKRAPYRPAAAPDAQARASRNFEVAVGTYVDLFPEANFQTLNSGDLELEILISSLKSILTLVCLYHVKFYWCP